MKANPNDSSIIDGLESLCRKLKSEVNNFSSQWHNRSAKDSHNKTASDSIEGQTIDDKEAINASTFSKKKRKHKFHQTTTLYTEQREESEYLMAYSIGLDPKGLRALSACIR